MIPIDINEAKRAYTAGKIRHEDLLFLNEVKAQDEITEKQMNYILGLAKKSLPYKVIIDQPKTTRDKVDPYFNDQYFRGDY